MTETYAERARSYVATQLRRGGFSPESGARHIAAAILKDEFVREFAVRPMKWSAHNLSRMLRLTGERPGRIAEMRALIARLASDFHDLHDRGRYSLLCCGGVFDHGEFWGRGGVPFALVGHPYRIDADQHALLAALARFPTLRVAVDDRPSYYGFGTHHVRIELPEPRRPFERGVATATTRAAAVAARRAFAAEFAADPRPVR